MNETALYRDVTLPENIVEHLRNLAAWLETVHTPRMEAELEWRNAVLQVVEQWDANEATEILVP